MVPAMAACRRERDMAQLLRVAQGLASRRRLGNAPLRVVRWVMERGRRFVALPNLPRDQHLRRLLEEKRTLMLAASYSESGPMLAISLAGPNVSFWMMTGLQRSQPCKTDDPALTSSS
jgi:hypothetical protein